MRLTATSLNILSLLPTLSHAITFDCKNILAEGVKWNLEKLGGFHQVSWVRPHANVVLNTTFKIDICQALELESADEKQHCDHGTRICGVEHQLDGDKDEYVGSWPITREYVHDGAHINPQYTRLKTDQDSDEKEPLEGVIAELGGGSDNNQDQKAIINFTCLPKEEHSKRTVKSEEDDDKKDPKEEKGRTEDGVGGRIDFVSYDGKELTLDWFSPYACENAASAPEKDQDPSSGGSSGGWGFFSWFFFLIFMLLFGFVAFTAWVNYTRNGARGWDLLPFSDILRDLPYILGDWWRRIASALGGSGTRGGYSAV